MAVEKHSWETLPQQVQSFQKNIAKEPALLLKRFWLASVTVPVNLRPPKRQPRDRGHIKTMTDQAQNFNSLTRFPPPVTYSGEDLTIELNLVGSVEYTKVSYPVRYGLFSRLTTRDWIMEFDQNQEIRHAKGKNERWPDPQEWLKRTKGNDWIYYSTGGYAGVVEAIGEYYLPNLMYTTNSLLGGKPFNDPEILKLCQHWQEILSGLDLPRPDMPEPVILWCRQVLSKSQEKLEQRSQALFDISGARVTVLPPDARHSDYDVLPVTISDGCLYKCRFCKVKNKKPFTPRTRQDIDTQLAGLKVLYGGDLVNYNAIYLGEHDALNAPTDLILYAADNAYKVLELNKSIMKRPSLYLFGSADALLNAEDRLFTALEASPYQTFINVGLESADQATLDRIGKPLTSAKVIAAFDRLQQINKKFSSVEISCNFIMDEGLPKGHAETMMALVREKQPFVQPKGTVYLSPLRFGRPSREVLFDFYYLKTKSRLPMFLYIIQRL